MKDRITRFMKSENLSPSQLADNIGVQRSGVSHIISGRNNPGLDFVQRILKHYPNLNPDWLLLNKGPMYRAETVSADYPMPEAPDIYAPDDMQPDIFSDPLTHHETIAPVYTDAVHPDQKKDTILAETIRKASKKETDKIVILYKDGSFDMYQQST